MSGNRRLRLGPCWPCTFPKAFGGGRPLRHLRGWGEGHHCNAVVRLVGCHASWKYVHDHLLPAKEGIADEFAGAQRDRLLSVGHDY